MRTVRGKVLKVLSVGAIAGILTIGSTSNAYAKVDSLVIFDKANNSNYEYKLSDLLDSQKQFYRGGSAPLYNDFQNLFSKPDNSIVSYHDSLNGYITTDSIMKAYTSSMRQGTTFDVDAFTESSGAEKTSIITYNKTEQNGQVVTENTNEDFRVISID